MMRKNWIFYPSVFLSLIIMTDCSSNGGSDSNDGTDASTDTDGDTDSDNDTAPDDTDDDTDNDTEECEFRATNLFGKSTIADTYFEIDENFTEIFQVLDDANINTVLVDTPPINDHFGYGTHASFLAFIQQASSQGLHVFGDRSDLLNDSLHLQVLDAPHLARSCSIGLGSRADWTPRERQLIAATDGG